MGILSRKDLRFFCGCGTKSIQAISIFREQQVDSHGM